MKWSAERRKKFEEKKQKATPQSKGRVYHGWIITEETEGFKAHIMVEWSENGQRMSQEMERRGNSGAAQAVEWWDKKVGKAIKLEPMLKGQYRVYTE